jgi:hypothetical protein
MLTPEVTLNLIRQRRYGARAMERRVKKCCAENPGCPYKNKCLTLYDAFEEARDNENIGKVRKPNVSKKARIEIYRQLRNLGVSSTEARSNLSMKRVRELAMAPP